MLGGSTQETQQSKPKLESTWVIQETQNHKLMQSLSRETKEKDCKVKVNQELRATLEPNCGGRQNNQGRKVPGAAFELRPFYS